MLVLCADDQPEVRSALRLLLEQEPWLHVVGETDCVQGLLAEAVLLQPDVVLLDWELPGLNKQVLTALQTKCPKTVVVAMSGRAESHKTSLAAGAGAFVSKGEPPEHLLAVLAGLASREASGG